MYMYEPAWNYLYELTVSCGNDHSPILWVIGYVARHSHLVLFVPGSNVELLTNSGRGDHALHQSCLPVAAQSPPWRPHPRKGVPGQNTVQKTGCPALIWPQAGGCPEGSRAGARGLSPASLLPSPRVLLDLLTITKLLWF